MIKARRDGTGDNRVQLGDPDVHSLRATCSFHRPLLIDAPIGMHLRVDTSLA